MSNSNTLAVLRFLGFEVPDPLVGHLDPEVLESRARSASESGLPADGSLEFPPDLAAYCAARAADLAEVAAAAREAGTLVCFA